MAERKRPGKMKRDLVRVNWQTRENRGLQGWQLMARQLGTWEEQVDQCLHLYGVPPSIEGKHCGGFGQDARTHICSS